MTAVSKGGEWVGQCECGAPLQSDGPLGVNCSKGLECPVEKRLRQQIAEAAERFRKRAEEIRLRPITTTATYCPDYKDACRRGCTDVCRRLACEIHRPSIDKPPQ